MTLRTRTIAILLVGGWLIFSQGCGDRWRQEHIRQTNRLIDLFFTAIQQQDWPTVRRLLSAVDHSDAERDAFIAETRSILLVHYTVLVTREINPDLIEYTVRLEYRAGTGAALQNGEQKLTARRDPRGVWRLKL